MLRQLLVPAMIILVSCSNDENASRAYDGNTQNTTVYGKENIAVNALKFINGYVEHLSEMNEAANVTDWVASNSLATKAFKEELKNVVDEAYRKDPELGLGADPILDAQDHPEKGFELELFDEGTNYLTVKGIDWPEFKLTMKIEEENGKWLVDGCGIVNIPNDKRAKRE